MNEDDVILNVVIYDVFREFVDPSLGSRVSSSAVDMDFDAGWAGYLFSLAFHFNI